MLSQVCELWSARQGLILIPVPCAVCIVSVYKLQLAVFTAGAQEAALSFHQLPDFPGAAGCMCVPSDDWGRKRGRTGASSSHCRGIVSSYEQGKGHGKTWPEYIYQVYNSITINHNLDLSVEKFQWVKDKIVFAPKAYVYFNIGIAALEFLQLLFLWPELCYSELSYCLVEVSCSNNVCVCVCVCIMRCCHFVTCTQISGHVLENIHDFKLFVHLKDYFCQMDISVLSPLLLS